MLARTQGSVPQHQLGTPRPTHRTGQPGRPQCPQNLQGGEDTPGELGPTSLKLWS